jgi:hypothetical protein
MRNRTLISGSDHTQLNKQKTLLNGRVFSYIQVLGLTFMLFIYLLVGILGLFGCIFIIIKVINLSSISDFTMVLAFGIACISLVLMRAGFHAFYEVIRESI